MIGKRLGSLAVVAILSWSMIPAFRCLAEGDEAKAKDRFVREYPIALERLRKAYLHVRGSGVETRTSLSKTKSSTSTTRFTFYVDGDNIRTSKEFDEPVGNSGNRVEVKASNAEYAFHAEAPKKDSAVALTALGRPNGGIHRALDTFRSDFLMAPFSVRLPIDKFLWNEATTTIERVIPVARDGRDLLRVEFKRVESFQGVPSTTECWLLVAPNEGWVLVEHGSSDGDFRHKYGGSIDYGPVVNGIPAPKRVIVENAVARRTFDFDVFAFERSPAEVFTLTSVGLPEIARPRWSRWRFFWLFNLAFAAVLLAIVVNRIRRSRTGGGTDHAGSVLVQG